MTSKKDIKFEIDASKHFTTWMAEQKISLVFTTYQTGKLFFLGLQPNGRLSIFERTLARCKGLYATPDAQTMYVSTLYQIWRFERATNAEQKYAGYDGLYIPQASYVTGNLDIHDIAIDKDDKLIFVNTLFSCLAKISDRFSFIPVWKPSFISKLAPEDRCHLNGLAIRKGKPKYVTSTSKTDINNGWRDRRRDGGLVIDIDSDEIIAEGLSMPYSPRWYQEKLWLLNSGTGELGFLDKKQGNFNAIVFCPGYLRGLAFVEKYAIVSISRARDDKAFGDLLLQDKLKSKNILPQCGLLVIDLEKGEIIHNINIRGVIKEIYDVAVLPEVKRPMALGFQSNEIEHVLSVGD